MQTLCNKFCGNNVNTLFYQGNIASVYYKIYLGYELGIIKLKLYHHSME